MRMQRGIIAAFRVCLVGFRYSSTIFEFVLQCATKKGWWSTFFGAGECSNARWNGHIFGTVARTLFLCAANSMLE